MPSDARDVVIVGAARTPFTRFGGALAGQSIPDLARHAIDECIVARGSIPAFLSRITLALLGHAEGATGSDDDGGGDGVVDGGHIAGATNAYETAANGPSDNDPSDSGSVYNDDGDYSDDKDDDEDDLVVLDD